MKQGLVLVVLALLLVFGEAKRGYWTQLQRVHKYEVLSLRVALIQQNLDVLENTLYDRADPYSDNYGKWWTASQILDLVAPPATVSEAVVAYLNAHGAQDVENHRDMIKFTIDAHLAESLFATELYYFEHSDGKTTVVRTQGDYTIPSEIVQHVDFISGLKEFPVPRETKLRGVDKGAVTVSHLQTMYSIPTTFANNKASSIGLIEFMNDTSYAESDLSMFSQQMGIPNITVSHIVGPYNTSSIDLESSLDIQYGGAIALNASIWFWTVHEWMYEFATDLLAATDAPLVVSMSWGWPEPLQCQVDAHGCGTGSSFQYVARVNTEFAKIGLNGITLVAASGDQGAPGDGNYVCENTTYPFSTIFPGASPYVLSVGATMLEQLLVEEKENAATPPICSQTKCATSTKEEVCSYPDALITSGGGFSNISPRPSYQNAAVSQYLSSGKLPDSSYFNKSNRGFPDVAGLGHNYVVFADGAAESVDGTSCSSPLLAGIITLLNSERLNNGKSSLGFINPVIYAAYASNAQTFKDITKGNNKCTENCCMKTGYEAEKGWDPVTGLGTPNFAALLSYVQSLK